jgi:hypothetical protein
VSSGARDAVARAVEAWTAHDVAHAVVPVDREIVDATLAIRTHIAELILANGPERDLYNACAVLGRLIAERGGSPSLAALTIEGARLAMQEPPGAWGPSAAAALGEGFAAGRSDMAKREAAASWEYPRCAVRLGDGMVAIAAGYPAEDAESAAGWAARVANAAVMAGARHVVVSGSDPARASLVDALTLAGVEVTSSLSPPTSEGARSWLPWRRPKR